MKRVIVTVILALVLLSTVVLAGCAPTEIRTNNFTVGLNPSVEVEVGNGNVSLVIGSDGEISVTANLKNPDRIEYSISQEGNRVTLEAKTRGGSRADVTITVPANTEFELTTGNGNVDVTGVQASGLVNSGNGSITLEQVIGDVTGSIGNGKMTLRDVEGIYVLSTGNGDIQLAGATGSFILSIGNGDIRLSEGKGSVVLSVGNGSISFEGELDPGSNNVISIGNGPVTVEITGSPSVSLDLEIDDRGKIRVDLPVAVSEQSEYRLIGTIGDGESTLDVHTGSGNITIR
ncbi:MAG: DUF4097 family beta strand repeat protein [Dehalococcoidales bacterium]|nr:MAG: DUF4097 family beta strand repeat protein [Dehalococcoidales bacterium]